MRQWIVSYNVAFIYSINWPKRSGLISRGRCCCCCASSAALALLCRVSSSSIFHVHGHRDQSLFFLTFSGSFSRFFLSFLFDRCLFIFRGSVAVRCLHLCFRVSTLDPEYTVCRLFTSMIYQFFHLLLSLSSLPLNNGSVQSKKYSQELDWIPFKCTRVGYRICVLIWSFGIPTAIEKSQIFFLVPRYHQKHLSQDW